MQVVLGHLLAAQVVVTVPLPIEVVPHEADVVTEAQRSVVVHYAVQVVNGLDLERFFQELGIATVVGRIEIADREINQVLKFAPLVAVKAEPLELND